MPQYHEADEYTHQPSEETDFSESMYVNYFDRSSGLGGFLRLGNRPNEGYAEVTNVTYLSDGSVLFSYQKPPIQHNRAFESGGLRFSVVEPLRRLTLSYRGTVFHLEDPKVLKNPKEAFTTSPQTGCEIVLDLTGVGGIHESVAGAAQSLDDVRYWKEHYEQMVSVQGTIKFEETIHRIEGLGLRDHSWGPRNWQSPEYYRWLSGVFDEHNGFGLMYLATVSGRLSRKGFITVNGADFDLQNIEITTGYVGPEKYHETIDLELATQAQIFRIKGKVLSILPLRNRSGGEIVRIAEGMTKWDWGGRLGYGLSEYHDHLTG